MRTKVRRVLSILWGKDTGWSWVTCSFLPTHYWRLSFEALESGLYVELRQKTRVKQSMAMYASWWSQGNPQKALTGGANKSKQVSSVVTLLAFAFCSFTTISDLSRSFQSYFLFFTVTFSSLCCLNGSLPLLVDAGSPTGLELSVDGRYPSCEPESGKSSLSRRNTARIYAQKAQFHSSRLVAGTRRFNASKEVNF